MCVIYVCHQVIHRVRTSSHEHCQCAEGHFPQIDGLTEQGVHFGCCPGHGIIACGPQAASIRTFAQVFLSQSLNLAFELNQFHPSFHRDLFRGPWGRMLVDAPGAPGPFSSLISLTNPEDVHCAHDLGDSQEATEGLADRARGL